MAAPFDLAELAVTGDPVAMVENVRHPSSQTAADYALSATGTLIYVPAPPVTSESAAVVWVDRSGQLIGRAVGDTLDNPRDPALSPDGTRLVLTTGPQNDGDLWSFDLRGRPPIRLAVLSDDRLPVWSPDSRQVAFTMTVDGADPNIHTVLADGSMLAPRPLRAQPVRGVVGAWSAADELVVMMPPIDSVDIGVIPVSGDGLPQRIMTTEYAEADAALSPDGRWLAYTSNRTGSAEVWVQRYPDGVAVRVSTNGGYEPHWSADGGELYYLAGTAVMAVTVEPGEAFSFLAPEQLFSGSYLMHQAPTVRSYAVAGDGRFLMIQLPDGATSEGAGTNIVVVQNWGEELERRVPRK
jgi:serine/threonine-protein kinase